MRKFPHDLPNYLRFRILRHLEVNLGSYNKISKLAADELIVFLEEMKI